MKIFHRKRIIYSVAAIAVTVLGLVSRAVPNFLSTLFGKYPGDALWALMLFLALGVIANRIPTTRLAIVTMTIATLVEVSQLYHADWIDAIRSYTLGHLILGSSFSVHDLFAYAVGVIIGVLVDRLLLTRASRKQ